MSRGVKNKPVASQHRLVDIRILGNLHPTICGNRSRKPGDIVQRRYVLLCLLGQRSVLLTALVRSLGFLHLILRILGETAHYVANSLNVRRAGAHRCRHLSLVKERLKQVVLVAICEELVDAATLALTKAELGIPLIGRGGLPNRGRRGHGVRVLHRRDFIDDGSGLFGGIQLVEDFRRLCAGHFIQLRVDGAAGSPCAMQVATNLAPQCAGIRLDSGGEIRKPDDAFLDVGSRNLRGDARQFGVNAHGDLPALATKLGKEVFALGDDLSQFFRRRPLLGSRSSLPTHLTGATSFGVPASLLGGAVGLRQRFKVGFANGAGLDDGHIAKRLLRVLEELLGAGKKF